MKAKKKRFLGLLGLFSVSAVTAFAVFLPQTGVFADTSSTDNISITVEYGDPRVEIKKPADNAHFSEPAFDGSYYYINVDQAKVCIQKLLPEPAEEDECVHVVKSGSFSHDTADYDSFNVDLAELGYGYGKYKLTVKGERQGIKNAASHSIEITYNAIDPGNKGETGGPTDPSGGVGKDPQTNEPVVNPHATDPKVDHVHVSVFQVKNDNTPKGPDQKADREFDVDRDGDTTLGFTGESCADQLPVGWYLLEFQAKDENGENIGIVENLWFYWEGNPKCEGWEPLGVPNTGGLFGGTNISRSDALITVAIIFVALAVLGAVLVMRKRSRR